MGKSGIPTTNGMFPGKVCAGLGLMVCWILAAPSFAQQPPSAPSSASASQDDTNKILLQRIRDLEAKMKLLEEKQVAAAPAAVTTEAPPPVVEAPRQNQVAERLQLRVFGDVGYHVSDEKGDTNTFDIGSLDLFMTARLSHKVSLLGEVLMISTNTNDISLDVERLVLQYHPSEHFNFAVGRYHTAIGYYNTAFHQGQWFQTAIGRPFMYEFDDRGGPLPLQEVGVSANGSIPSGKFGLHYIAEVGNGRSHLLGQNPAQNSQDTNNGKSFNVGAFAQLAWVPGLQLGFSVYHDKLTFSDNINHGELISTVHVVYLNSTYEWLNEGMLVRHGNSATGVVANTSAFYSQFSRRFGSYRPYFRYEYINASDNDPIYGDPADGPVVGRRNGPTAGLRWDFNEHAAAKLQYERQSTRGEKSSNGLATQFAFTF